MCCVREQAWRASDIVSNPLFNFSVEADKNIRMSIRSSLFYAKMMFLLHTQFSSALEQCARQHTMQMCSQSDKQLQWILRAGKKMNKYKLQCTVNGVAFHVEHSRCCRRRHRRRSTCIYRTPPHPHSAHVWVCGCIQTHLVVPFR